MVVTRLIYFVNASGDLWVIFIYPVTLIADWAPLYACTDAMGHSSNMLCFFYVFPMCKGTAVRNSRVYKSDSFTTDVVDEIPCNNEYYKASQVALRSSPKNVGLNSSSQTMETSYFTEKLSQKLFRHLQDDSPKTSHVLLANNFLSVAAAPYHLISVLSKDVLQLCFRSPDFDVCRIQVDSAILYYISSIICEYLLQFCVHLHPPKHYAIKAWYGSNA